MVRDVPIELAAIDLTLQPRKFNKVPEWQGRAAQALFYSSLHRLHPMISETIHDLHKWQAMMPKPFTMSTLIGTQFSGDMLVLHPDKTLKLRLTTLHPHLTGVSLHGVLPMWQSEGIRLHDQPLWIRHTQRLYTSYDELLNYAPDNKFLKLNFTSPTAFKLTGKGYLAQASPQYIFNSLYNRWNSFADKRLPKALHESIQSQLELVEANVQQKTLAFARGRKGIISGFYGNVTIAIHERSQELRQMLNALAHFAEFSGVGIKTTIGMGQVAAQQ